MEYLTQKKLNCTKQARRLVEHLQAAHEWQTRMYSLYDKTEMRKKKYRNIKHAHEASMEQLDRDIYNAQKALETIRKSPS